MAPHIIYQCFSVLLPNQSNETEKSRRTHLNLWLAMSLKRWLAHHRSIEIRHNRFARISLAPRAGSQHNLVILIKQLNIKSKTTCIFIAFPLSDCKTRGQRHRFCLYWLLRNLNIYSVWPYFKTISK